MIPALRLAAASGLALSLALVAAPASADMPGDDGGDDDVVGVPCDDKEEGDACSLIQTDEDFEGVCIEKSDGLQCCDAEGKCLGGVSSSGCAIAPGEPGSLVALGVFVAAAALWATRRADARR